MNILGQALSLPMAGFLPGDLSFAPCDIPHARHSGSYMASLLCGGNLWPRELLTVCALSSLFSCKGEVWCTTLSLNGRGLRPALPPGMG